jgi:hypothetical protein
MAQVRKTELPFFAFSVPRRDVSGVSWSFPTSVDDWVYLEVIGAIG